MAFTNKTLTAHLDEHPGMKVEIGGGGTLTLTNSPLAAQFATGAIAATVAMIDCTNFTQVRLRGVVTTGSASASTPVVVLLANPTYSTTFSDYANIGATAVALSLTTAGGVDSGWINIAKVETSATTFLVLAEQGGDGVIDPVITAVYAEFR